MIAFFAVMKSDWLQLLGSWKKVLLLLALPVIMLIVLSIALLPLQKTTSLVAPFPLALVDLDQSIWTQMLIRQLSDISLIGEVIKTDEESAKELIKNGKAAAAIIIPEGLSNSVGNWKPVRIVVYGSSQQSLQSNIIYHIAEAAASIVSTGLSSIETARITLIDSGISEERANAEVQNMFYDFFQQALARREVFDNYPQKSMAISLIEYYGAGLMSVFFMFSSLFCMKQLVEDRQNGVLKRIMSTQVRMCTIFSSRIIISLFLSLMQFFFIMFIMAAFFQSYQRIPLLFTFSLFLSTVLASSTYAIFVSTLSDEPATVNLIGYLGVLIMAVAGGSIYPATLLPDWVTPAANCTIVRWAREGFLGVFTGRTDEIARANIFLIVIAIAFLLLAIFSMHLRERRA